MNTTHNPTAAEIAKGLSAEDVNALRYLDRKLGTIIDEPTFRKLYLLGLVATGAKAQVTTDLGKQVLAATRETPPAEAGKPTTITAKEFVEQVYAEKIAKGECEVRDDDNQIIQSIHVMLAEDRYRVCIDCADDKWYVVSAKKDPTKFTVTWLPTTPQPATAQAANETAEPQTFAELCEREIVKIRSLTLKDDEYTGDLLADAVASPVGITMCVEARMKQIADLQGEVERLKKQIKKLKRKSDLDDGFIDHLTQESEG